MSVMYGVLLLVRSRIHVTLRLPSFLFPLRVRKKFRIGGPTLGSFFFLQFLLHVSRLYTYVYAKPCGL